MKTGLCLATALVTAVLAGCNRAEEQPAPRTAATAGQGTTIAPRKSSPARDDLHPIVVLRTNHGDITVRLDAEKAPRTVYNFMSYANTGHYDETIFHQVEDGYALLAGSYTADLVERRGRYPIVCEATNGLKNRRGTIAMARSPEAINSATCEFFINLVDNPQLDHRGDEPANYGYCVFGEVIEGWDALDKIAKVKVKRTEKFEKLPVDTVMIQHVRPALY